MSFAKPKNWKIRPLEKVFFAVAILVFFAACQKTQVAEETKVTNGETPKASATVEVKPDGVVQTTPIDVAKLADKSAAEIDGILGKPLETREITIPKKGEYRLYKIADEPKGLAVRFYGGRAKNFNLILSQPAGTAKEALKKAFAIDVGNALPAKDKLEPLSEKWSGEFGGVKFLSVYAKRESENKGFVFVLAEVAD